MEWCKKGIMDALADRGYEDGKNVRFIYKNAQADFSMINAIIQDFIRRKVDIIVPLSTPCLQAAMHLAGKNKNIKTVFTYIYDPYRIGAARTPTDHPPNITGVNCRPNIKQILELIKDMFPQKKTLGVVWNSSESNSESVLMDLRPIAEIVGLRLIEATVTGPAEVLDAAKSLVSRGAQVFLNAGDNTLSVSFASYVKVAARHHIPVFTVDSEQIGDVLVFFGPDVYQTGYDGGIYLARVLDGEDPAGIPIYRTPGSVMGVNMETAARQGFTIPEGILKRADRIVEKTGEES